MRDYSIAVVGEDRGLRTQLTGMVAKVVKPGCRIVCNMSDINGLLEVMRRGVRMDVLFVGMKVGRDAAACLGAVRDIKELCPWCQVILYSDRPEDAMAAYGVNHAYFLLAPFETRYVDSAFREATRLLRENSECPFGLKIGSSLVKLRPSQILYAESNRHKVSLHVRGGRKLDAYLRLVQLTEVLPGNFVQIHKSFLVNMEHVTCFGVDSVEMTDGAIIPVSQSRRKQVREAFSSSCLFVKGV